MYFVIPFILAFLACYLVKKQGLSKKAQVLEAARAKVFKIDQAKEELEKKFKINLEDIQTDFDSIYSTIDLQIKEYEDRHQKRSTRLEVLQSKLSQTQTDISSLEASHAEKSQSLIQELEKLCKTSSDKILQEIKKTFALTVQRFSEKNLQNNIKQYQRQAARVSRELIKESMQIFDMESSVDRLSKFLDFSKKQFKNATQNESQYLDQIAQKLDVTIEAVEDSQTIKVSGFMLWRQEVAKVLVQKLAEKPRVSTEELDKLIELESQRFDEKLIRLGSKIAKKIQIEQDDKQFLKLLGRMKFRTSYGQNILYHSFEVGFFCQYLASQIQEDPRMAFLAGFFHDFGKTVDQEQGGSHDLLGAELLEQFGFDYQIYHPAHSHHYLIPIETIIGELVVVADKISSSRQGARSESAEMYYERVAGLEKIAKSHPEINKGFALSAARELRCLLDAKKTTDQIMPELAENIAQEIQDELVYPGKIKVNLIRSVDSVEYANKTTKK